MTVSETSERQRLPEAQQWALKRAKLLAWLTIAYLIVDTVVLYLIKGNSQAMQAAWVQDLLGMVPPLAFLIGTRVAARRATRHHPFGFHQSTDIAHLVSATALLGFGGFLLVESTMTLLGGQRPDIGLFSLFGVNFDFWQGWIMIAVMFVGAFPPLVLGRLKLKPAKLLHNKVLFTDSKMNKADWLSSLASILGVTGIGLGIWWADAAAAIIISLDILQDGIQNMRSSLDSLTESSPSRLGKSEPHPLPGLVNRRLSELPWVKEVGCRTREEGQVFHIEAFVVPDSPGDTSAERLIEAREECLKLNWKIHDVSVIPVRDLPEQLRTDRADSDEF